MDITREFDRRVDERWYGHLDCMREVSEVGAQLADFLADVLNLQAVALATLGKNDSVRSVCVAGGEVNVQLEYPSLNARMRIAPHCVRTELMMGTNGMSLATKFSYEQLQRFEVISLEQVIEYHLSCAKKLDSELSAQWASSSASIIKNYLAC